MIDTNSEFVQKQVMQAFEDGKLFDLNIGKKIWGMALTPADIGKKPDEVPKNWNLGRRFLVPDEVRFKIDRIEGRARRYLEAASLPFPVAGIKFVRQKRIADVLVSLGAIRDEYYAEVANLIRGYDDIKNKMKETYPDQWHLMESKYPSVAELEKAHYFRFSAVVIQFPKELHEIDINTLMAQEKANNEYRTKLEATLGDKQKANAEYRRRLEQELVNQREQAKATMNRFVEDTVVALRGKVVKVFESLLEKRKDKKPLIKANIDAINEVMEYVDEMDFLDDKGFKSKLGAIRQKLADVESFKDNEQATAELEKLMAGTIAYANESMSTSVASLQKTYFGRKLAV